MTKQRAAELANEINIKKLAKEIEGIVNYPVSPQCEIKSNDGRYDIYINDPVNYADQMGMMSCILDSVFIQSSGSGEYDRRKKIIWFSFNFIWTCKTGGKNGEPILTATFNFNSNKWDFEK